MLNANEDEIRLSRPCAVLDVMIQGVPTASNQSIASDASSNQKDQRLAADPLTSRQREILRMIADGITTKRIADTLHISPKTVESHRIHIKEKLGISSIPGLVRYAMRIGLVCVDN